MTLPANLSRQFNDSTPLDGVFGITEAFSFDPKSLLPSQHTVDPQPGGPFLTTGPRLFDTQYGYSRPNAAHSPITASVSQVGQLLTQTDLKNSSGSQSLSYDMLGRLSQATLGLNPASGAGTFESRQVYGYDRYGNRVTVDAQAPGTCGNPSCPLPPAQRDGGAVLSAEPGTNRILETGIAYDEAGNLTAAPRLNGQIQRYQYDAAGRLVSVLDQSGKTLETNIYGADRRRVLSVDATNHATAYGWDGGNTISQYYLASGGRRFYVREPGGTTLITLSDDGAGGQSVQYRVNDRYLTRALLDSNVTQPLSAAPTFTSTPVNSRPFGTDPPERRFLTSNSRTYSEIRQRDSPMQRTRFYSPEQGRFLQPDPLGTGAASITFPQTLNLYSFALNDPVNLGDPTGLRPITIVTMKPGCGVNDSEEWGMETCMETYTFEGGDDTGVEDNTTLTSHSNGNLNNQSGVTPVTAAQGDSTADNNIPRGVMECRNANLKNMGLLGWAIREGSLVTLGQHPIDYVTPGLLKLGGFKLMDFASDVVANESYGKFLGNRYSPEFTPEQAQSLSQDALTNFEEQVAAKETVSKFGGRLGKLGLYAIGLTTEMDLLVMGTCAGWVAVAETIVGRLIFRSLLVRALCQARF